MTTSRAPLLLARAAVELAVRPLPELDDRLRYRAEFAADLSVLGAVEQLRYAAGVLARAFALRAALETSPTRAEKAAAAGPTAGRTEEEGMPDPAQRGPLWRCRVFHWHDFVVRSTDDGGRFQQCRLCGIDRGPVSHHPMTTPPYYVGSAGS